MARPHQLWGICEQALGTSSNERRLQLAIVPISDEMPSASTHATTQAIEKGSAPGSFSFSTRR
jgi:hypothetical protein